jgi:hypothetical protein
LLPCDKKRNGNCWRVTDGNSHNHCIINYVTVFRTTILMCSLSFLLSKAL